MEVVYTNNKDFKNADKEIIGIIGDINYLDKYLDIYGISYKESWTVRRLLNGLHINLNKRIKDIFAYLDLDIKYLNYKISDLSHTILKYVLLSYLLLNNRRFIIFDYFDAGLTYKEQKKTINIIKKLHDDGIKVVIITNNYVFLSKIVDRIIITDNNKEVFEGTIDELLVNKKYIKDTNIIEFIELANEKNAKLQYTFDRNDLIKDIYRSVS